MTPKFDVFLCYAWAGQGKQLADTLYLALRDQGVTVFKDDEGTRPTDESELLPTVMAALLNSRILVPLMTPQFDASPHCFLELATALTQAYRLDDGSLHRVKPVLYRIQPGQVPLRQLKARQLRRWEASTPAELAADLAAEVEKIKVTDPRRFGDAPVPELPRWYPRGSSTDARFYGRRRELWMLHAALRVPTKPANRGQPVVSVYGGGGLGKTALCEQYARWVPQDHPGGVFVIRLAGSRSGRTAPASVLTHFHLQVAEIGRRLGLSEQDCAAPNLTAAVARELQQREDYLWLVDDVPTGVDKDVLRKLIAPTDNGRTLITSRGRFGDPVSEELELGPLTGTAALELLTSQHPFSQDDLAERAAAKDIVANLGEHPLGLKLAAGLTARTEFTGYQEFRASLRAVLPEQLELAEHLADDLPAAYVIPFSGTVLRSWDSLPEPAREVLATASVLGPTPIPDGLVTGVLAELNQHRTWDPGVAQRGFDALQQRGLASHTDATLTVHALVARAARVLANQAERRRLRELAMRRLTDVLDASRGAFADRSVGVYLPHVHAVVGLTTGTGEWSIGSAERYLLNETGRVESELGHSAASLATFTALLDACRAAPECDELTRLQIQVGVGAAHQEHGQYAAARELQEDAVRRLTALGHQQPEDAEIFGCRLWAINNLALTCLDQGEPDTARTLLTSVYRAWRAVGRTAPACLTALNNLVCVLGQCGTDATSRTRSQRLALRYAIGANALWYRTAGPDARGTLDSLTSGAANLLRLGEVAAALDTFEYILERRTALLGANHPNTIDTEQNVVVAQRALHHHDR